VDQEPRSQHDCGRLDLTDVARLHALLTTVRLIGDLVAFFEGLEPTSCYRAVVHEEVIASLIRLDEAVALLAVEPLDRSLGHEPEARLSFLGPPCNKKAAPSLRWAALHSCYKPTFFY
jgi:hypothetical protein